MTATVTDLLRHFTKRIEAFCSRKACFPVNTSVLLHATRNHTAACFALALLSVVHNIKGFILSDAFLDKHNLRTTYGIDPYPLFNFNRPDIEFFELVREMYDIEEADVARQWELLLMELDRIRTDRLLGRDTGAKLAYVADVTGYSLTALRRARHGASESFRSNILALNERTVEMLGRHKYRIGGDSRAATIAQVQERLIQQRLQLELHALAWSHPVCATEFERFCHIFADEIAETLGQSRERHGPLHQNSIRSLNFVRGDDIEVAFARRDRRFVSLGDRFGDCTASKSRRQVDHDIANIHWTVYSWLLDPFYRVIEVYCLGESVLKGHVLPILVRGCPALLLDAIEAVPKTRDSVRGRPNPHISKLLFERRHELLARLFDTVAILAQSMGLDTVYVDKFSNSTWIRDTVSELPVDFYHVREIERPFGGTDVIRGLITMIGGIDAMDILEEVQALNLALWDQQLRRGFKEVGVLVGRVSGDRIPLRGP